MPLNFGTNPQVYHSHPGTLDPTADPTIEGGRYWRDLARKRWGVYDDGLGPHPLAHDGDSVVHFVRAGTQDGTLNPQIAQILKSRLSWDGSTPLTYLEAADLNRITDPWSGKPWSVTFNNILQAVPPEATATPTPPPTAPAIQGSELWETEYNVVQQYPKGTAIWRATGALETAFSGILALSAQAGAGDPASGLPGDGVATFAEELAAARSGLFEFFFAIQSAYDAGRDYLLADEKDRAQTNADVVWKTIHTCREKWAALKDTGWVLQGDDPRPSYFKWSRLNRIAWTILAQVTTACGFYGIQGEVQANGARDAFYVDPFMAWENQDPNHGPGGIGGIGLPGAPKGKPGSFAAGVAKAA